MEHSNACNNLEKKINIQVSCIYLGLPFYCTRLYYMCLHKLNVQIHYIQKRFIENIKNHSNQKAFKHNIPRKRTVQTNIYNLLIVRYFAFMVQFVVCTAFFFLSIFQDQTSCVLHASFVCK